MQALSARIRPHFLFNTLTTIASLTRIDPALAEQAVEDLAELFRASVGDAKQRISLAEELVLCRQYLRIESLRLGERCQIEWQIDTLPLDASIPPLTLQPLLENAICYGIQPRPEGGVIRVTGLCDGRHIKIDIENPLPPESHQDKRQGLHLALDNLRQRLQACYGGSLETRHGPVLYQVSLRFPYHPHKQQ
jgi:two-component system sensor histidine kinase AlgZ